MHSKLALAALLVWAAPAPAGQDAAALQLCAQIGGISAELTDISGMKLKRPVPCDFISKEKINAFLKDRIKEVARPEDIRAEELALKKFGLLPPDFDLAATTVELLTEQAAAFYDYERKKLFITESTPSETQAPVLAHELAHALADQNYNLSKFIRQGRNNDDGSTARLAVMEGQASWLMSEYLARRSGQSLLASPALLAAMSTMTEEGAGQYPVFDKAPLYLRASLIFPYTKGMTFQHAAVERDGKNSFGNVFLRPPVSTQQILHPEKYTAGLQPTRPPTPEPRLPRGYRSLVGGTLGELEHMILLEQYTGKEYAETLAPHWRGSTFEVRENRKAHRAVLLYASEWDDEAAARKFFEAYRDVLRKKWKKMEEGPLELNGTQLRGVGDDGHFLLRRSGALVTSVEGADAEVH